MSQVDPKEIIIEITRTKRAVLRPDGTESGIYEDVIVSVRRRSTHQILTLAHLGRLLQVAGDMGAPAETTVSNTGTGSMTEMSVRFRAMEAARDDVTPEPGDDVYEVKRDA